MADIKVLGSDSKGNAIVAGSQPPLMFDAGLPFKSLQRTLAYKVTQLAACVVTHEHMDHARAASTLLGRGVEVMASRGTLEALDLADHHRATALLPYQLTKTRKGRWGVIGIPVEHDAKEPMAIYAGRGSVRLLYVTDTPSFRSVNGMKPTCVLIETNHSRAEMRQRAEYDERAQRVDRSHMSLEAAIEALKTLDLSACTDVILLHLSDANADEAGYVKEIQAAIGKRIRVTPAAGGQEGQT